MENNNVTKYENQPVLVKPKYKCKKDNQISEFYQQVSITETLK